MHGMKGSCIPHLTCTSLGSMHMQVGRHPGNPSCIYPFKRLAELSRMMCGYCNAGYGAGTIIFAQSASRSFLSQLMPICS